MLVIDDIRDMSDLTRVILEGAGYAVDVAEDGEVGLNALRVRPADVIVTDIFMTNRDGLEMLSRLRREYHDVKVLAISGGGSRMKGSSYLSTVRESARTPFWPSPFGQDELLRAVRALIQ